MPQRPSTAPAEDRRRAVLVALEAAQRRDPHAVRRPDRAGRARFSLLGLRRRARR